jgi:porin
LHNEPPIHAARVVLVALGLLALVALAIPGPAQAADPLPEPEPEPVPASVPEPTLSLAAVYTGESWRAAAGGVARGSAYIDNLDLQMKLDGTARGWPGSSAYVYVLYNNGHEFADPYTGSLQGISNIEAVPATRLYEAWLETPAPARGSVRFGLYNFNSEFDVNDVGALFLGPSHGIGAEFAGSGVTGPSIFPVTALALRYRREGTTWRTQCAVLDGIPGDPRDARRTYIHIGGSDGALYAAEIGRALGPVNATLGAWHYTMTLPDLLAVNAGGGTTMHGGSNGYYALASASLWSDAASGRELSGFIRVGVADQRVYQVHRYLGLGLVSTGPLAARPKDSIGLALARAENGAPFRSAQSAAGAPVDARESDFELSYRAVLNEHFFVQPDLRYIVDPGTDPALANTWVVGVRFQLAAWYAR